MYFPFLDGLRFVAFLMVFVHHLPQSGVWALRKAKEHGWIGVHVFLFLSAYLLTALLAEESRRSGGIAVWKFLVRRSLRIWPLYFAFVGVTIGLVCVGRPLGHADWLHVVGLVTFTSNVVTGLCGYSEVGHTSHLWTIGLEEQFYLALPWGLAWGLSRGGRAVTRMLVFIGLGFVAFRMLSVVMEWKHPWIWTSVASADSLLLGTWFGLRAATSEVQRSSLAPLIVAVGSVLILDWMPGVSTDGWHSVPLYSVVACGAAAAVLFVVRCRRVGAVLALPFMRYLGKISYGLYVFHMLAIECVRRVFRAEDGSLTSWLLFAGLALSCTIGMAALSYAWLEKPVLRYKRRFEIVESRPL